MLVQGVLTGDFPCPTPAAPVAPSSPASPPPPAQPPPPKAMPGAPDAELERLFTELKQAWWTCNTQRDISDDDLGVLSDRVWKLEQRLFKTPARTPRGLLVKLRAWRFLYPDDWGDNELSGPADVMIVKAIWRDAHAVAGEPAMDANKLHDEPAA